MLIDFESLELPSKPNHALALPEDEAPGRDALPVPIYQVSVGALREAFVAMAAAQPRTNLLELDREARQAKFWQKSRFLGFTDLVYAEFVERGDGRSSLRLFSHSCLGYWDLGVNRRRLEIWLKELSIRVG